MLKNKKYPINFNNDIYFKYLFGCDDVESDKMRKFIIKKVTGIELEKTTVLNPEELSPENFQSKKTILDVHCSDEDGRIYYIEMQVGKYTDELGARLQYYNSRLISLQVKKGEDYEALNDVYHIVFLDDKSPKNELIIDYAFRDSEGNDIRGSSNFIILVFLKTIKNILKDRKIVDLDEFESMCYILAFNPNDDILKLGKESVSIMMSKYDQMLESKELFTLAEKAHMVEYEQKQELKRMKEQGIQEGKQQGIKEGIQQGKQDMVRTLISEKYGVVDEEWINGLNEYQINMVIKASLTSDTFDELKQIVDNN